MRQSTNGRREKNSTNQTQQETSSIADFAIFVCDPPVKRLKSSLTGYISVSSTTGTLLGNIQQQPSGRGEYNIGTSDPLMISFSASSSGITSGIEINIQSASQTDNYNLLAAGKSSQLAQQG